MLRTKAIYTFVFAIITAFVCLQFFGRDQLAHIFEVLTVPAIALLYLSNVRDRSYFILTSLIAFSLSEALSFFTLSGYYDFDYYIGNGLYMIAYLALILEIISHLNVKTLLRHFKLHLLILVILNIYANYLLLDIVKDYVPETDYSIEVVYNIFTILLFTVSMLNYFFRFDKKSLFLFLGALFITFSEALQIAYYYPLASEANNLKIIFTLLIFSAYYLFYKQAGLQYNRVLVFSNETC